MGADALEAGMRFRVQGDDGLQIITVVTVKGDTVTVDGNHPLAGMTLNFDVTIVDGATLPAKSSTTATLTARARTAIRFSGRSETCAVR